MLAILGYFSRFSPNDHTDICLSEQQDFTESTLLLYIPRYLDFKAQYPETQGKWPYYVPELPYLVLLGKFVAGTFRHLPACAQCWTGALISHIWKNGDGFIASKIEKMAILSIILAILHHFYMMIHDSIISWWSMLIETYVLGTNRTLQNPLWCFIFRDIPYFFFTSLTFQVLCCFVILWVVFLGSRGYI